MGCRYAVVGAVSWLGVWVHQLEWCLVQGWARVRGGGKTGPDAVAWAERTVGCWLGGDVPCWARVRRCPRPGERSTGWFALPFFAHYEGNHPAGNPVGDI